MNSIVRNILAVIAGLVFGGLVNMGIIMLSGSIIPPPAGVDVTSMEGLKAGMHLFEPKHFIMPFLAHALGTMAGAYTTAFIAVSHKLKLAMVIAVCFLVGGIINVYLLPSPVWYAVLDIAGAYIPFAYFGWKLVRPKKA